MRSGTPTGAQPERPGNDQLPTRHVTVGSTSRKPEEPANRLCCVYHGTGRGRVPSRIVTSSRVNLSLGLIA